MRGYGFKNIGVKQANGDVTGGQSLVEGSIELRQRFGKSFGAVAFADVGVVGEDSFSGFSIPIPRSALVSASAITAALVLSGSTLPFRWMLMKGDPDFAFYAGIGHAF